MRQLTAVVLALSAFAAAAAPAYAKGDPERGEVVFYTCTGCHGIAGYFNSYPSYRVPKIGGQNYEYLVAALTAYQSGTRSHPTMRAQGESLSAQDIEDIASFLALQKKAD
ncbi:MAG: c-type cytochrome [Xanthomonadales bacterium]|nr:c-type cytochrome [Xanthomonadales bacterium]